MLRFLILLSVLILTTPLQAQPSNLPTRQALIDATVARNGATFNDLGLDADGIAQWVDHLLTDEAQLAGQSEAEASSRASFETRLRLAQTYYNLGFLADFERHLVAIESAARALGPAGISRLSRVALMRDNRQSFESDLPGEADRVVRDIAGACSVAESVPSDIQAIVQGLDVLGGTYAVYGYRELSEAMLGASLDCYRILGRDASDLVYIATLARLRLAMTAPDDAYAALLPGLNHVARRFDQAVANAFDVERGGSERSGDMAEWGGLYLDVAWRLYGGADGAGGQDLAHRAWSNDVFDIAQRVYDTPASAALRRRAARNSALHEGDANAVALIDEQARLLAQERVDQAQAPRRPLLNSSDYDFVGAVNVYAPSFGEGEERVGFCCAPSPRIGEITQELGHFAEQLTARFREPWRVDQLLQAGEGMLLIVPTERGTHIFAFAHGQPTNWYHSALNAAQIRDLVREIRFHVGANVAPNAEEFGRWGEQPFAREAAYRLYAQLVAPAVAPMDNIHHIYIVAGGPLESLPFSLLVTEPPVGNGFDPHVLRTTRWMADRFAVSRMPTVDSFLILKGEGRIRRGDAVAGRSPRRRARFIGFADPALNGNAVTCGVDAVRGGSLTRSMPRDFATDAARGDMVRRLPRLACSGEEAALVSAEAHAARRNLYLGADNREPMLQAASLADATILLFATHALMPGELPGLAEPALVFTPPDVMQNPDETATWIDDGLLTGGEIGDLRMAPDWLILSACNSGGGSDSVSTNQAGGLTPWFFAAGANRILATKWPLLDVVAARLTRNTMHIARRDHVGGAEALRRAMIAVRADRSHDDVGATSFAHPMVWAVFELVGDGALPAGG